MSAGFLTLPWERSLTWSNASIPFMSKKIPQSVVAFTFASSIISPSFKFFKTSLTSAFLLFSRTALLLVQTFPRFLSIRVAKTLTGIFIKWSIFFSGLTSIWLAGIKVGRPSTVQIYPPLTLPVMYPTSSSCVSKTFSIFFQAFILLAFSRLMTISPLKLSIRSK